mgnify:CR=1 FL=1
MVTESNQAWFMALRKEREQQQIQQQFAQALAQDLQLNLNAPGLVLAALLGQPLHLSNSRALEKWTTDRLEEEGMEADQPALELLSNKLRNQLSEMAV